MGLRPAGRQEIIPRKLPAFDLRDGARVIAVPCSVRATPDGGEHAVKSQSVRPWGAVPIALLFPALVLVSSVLGAGPATKSGLVSTSRPASRPAGAPAPTAHVIPDTGGPISELVLHYDPVFEHDLAPVYDDLFDALGGNTRLQVVCPDSLAVRQFFTKWGARAGDDGRPVQVINARCPLTLWARDRRIARAWATGQSAAAFVPISVWDYERDKCSELGVPGALARMGWIPGIVQNGLHIEGGNVVSNSRHAFVGNNVIEDNHAAFGNRDRLMRTLREVIGLPIILVADSDGQVPWCHVDMYLTPIDDRTVLVADPKLARALLADSDDELCLESPDQDTFMAYAALGYNANTLDSVAARIAAAGYEVLRVPAVLDPDENWMVTYNNVLMETRRDGVFVYMPTYGVPSLDRSAARVYESLGFQVRGIDVSRVFESGGAIRCMANVTARGPFPQRVVRRRPATTQPAQNRCAKPALPKSVRPAG